MSFQIGWQDIEAIICFPFNRKLRNLLNYRQGCIVVFTILFYGVDNYATFYLEFYLRRVLFIYILNSNNYEVLIRY